MIKAQSQTYNSNSLVYMYICNNYNTKKIQEWDSSSTFISYHTNYISLPYISFILMFIYLAYLSYFLIFFLKLGHSLDHWQCLN